MDASQGSTVAKKQKKARKDAEVTATAPTKKKKKVKSKTDADDFLEVEENNPGMLLTDFMEEPIAATKKAVQSLKSSKSKKAGKKKRPAADDEDDLDLASLGQGMDDSEATAATAKLLSRISAGATSSSARARAGPRHAEEARPENEFQAGSAGEEISIEDLLAPLAESTGFSDVKKQLQGMSKTEAMPEPQSEVKQGREERAARYDRSSGEMKKWMPQIDQMQKADQVVLGEADDQRPASTSSLVGSFKPLDDFEKELEEVTRAAGASEADMKGAKMLPVNSSIKDAKEIQQRAKLKALMLREQQMSKRVKKIKSKAYHRIHRKAEQKEREVLLERLEHENPELAKSLRQDYEKKFAEKRLQRQRNARKKWAATMQRFAKGDIRAGMEISKQAQDANDEQRALRRVIQGRNADQDEDSDAVDLSDSDGDDDGQKGLAQRTVDKAKKLTTKELDGLKQGDEIPTTGLFGMPFMRNAIKEKRDSAKAEAQSLLNELEGVGARLDAKDVIDSDDERTQKGPADSDNGITKKPREFSPEELEKASKTMDLDDIMFGGEDVTQAHKSTVDGALTVRGVEAQKLPSRPNKGDSKASAGSNSAVSSSTNAATANNVKDDDNPWLAQTESTTRDVDEDNPWLATEPTSTEALSQAPTSMEASAEEGKKGRKRKGAASAAEPGKNPKRRRPADNLDPNADSLASGAELLNVLDADAEEARQQRDLVRATFIEGTQAEDFDDEKDELEREQEEKDKPEELVGWGSWTGEGVKKRPAPKGKGKGKSAKGKGKGTSKQASQKPDHVVINQGDAATPASQAKYFVDKVPFPFKNPQQYDQEMRMPSGPEWNTLSQHLQRVKPKVFSKVGAIVPPLHYIKNLAPEQRESAINTWAAPKQPKRLKARF